MGAAPFVDARLQRVAVGEKLAVAGREVVQQRRQVAPEAVRLQPRAGKRFPLDEVPQLGRHKETVKIHRRRLRRRVSARG